MLLQCPLTLQQGLYLYLPEGVRITFLHFPPALSRGMEVLTNLLVSSLVAICTLLINHCVDELILLSFFNGLAQAHLIAETLADTDLLFIRVQVLRHLK